MPFFIQLIDTRRVCSGGFVVSFDTVLFVEGGVLADVFYVDGDFWGYGGPWGFSFKA